ncbi:hypothetical protein HN954_01615 [bacterium]|nr:hypothetical protein [bacterium]MBT7772739.1 hypothetical protein [bacterium]
MKFLEFGCFDFQKKFQEFVWNTPSAQPEQKSIKNVVEEKIESENQAEEKEKAVLEKIDVILKLFPYKTEEICQMLETSLGDLDSKNPEFTAFQTAVDDLIEKEFLSVLPESERGMYAVENVEYNFSQESTISKYSSEYSEEQKTEIVSKLQKTGFLTPEQNFENIDSVGVQQALIDAGFLTANDDMALDGKIGPVTLAALDKYHENLENFVKEQKENYNNSAKFETLELKNFETTKNVKADCASLNKNSTVFELQNQSRLYASDFELFNNEASFLENEYFDLTTDLQILSGKIDSADDLNPPAEEAGWNWKKIGSGAKKFLSSTLKTAALPAVLIGDLFGVQVPDKREQKKKLEEKKKELQKKFKENQEKLQAKKGKIVANGTALKSAGDGMKTEQETQKNQHLAANKNQTKTAAENQKRSEEDFKKYKQQKEEIENQKQEIENQKQEIGDASKNVESQKETQKNSVSGALKQIENSLEKTPKHSPQYKKLLKTKQRLLQKQTALDSDSPMDYFDKIGQDVDLNLSEIGISNLMMDAVLADLETGISAMETLQNQSSDRATRIKANFNQNIEQIESLDVGIDEMVDQINPITESHITSLDSIGKELPNLEVKTPSVWQQTVGGMCRGISESVLPILTNGLTFVPKLASKAGQWLENTNIWGIKQLGKTIDFTADVVTGVVEGASEIVGGIATMIEKPKEALKGLGALIGRDPATGKWSAKTCFDTFSMIGKSMIGMDENGNWGEDGNRGMALGKAIANIGSLFIPGSQGVSAARLAVAASKGGMLAKVAAITIKAPLAFTKAVGKNALRTGPRMLKSLVMSPVTIPRNIVRTFVNLTKNPAKLKFGNILKTQKYLDDLTSAVEKNSKVLKNGNQLKNSSTTIESIVDNAGKIKFDKIKGLGSKGQQQILDYARQQSKISKASGAVKAAEKSMEKFITKNPAKAGKYFDGLESSLKQTKYFSEQSGNGTRIFNKSTGEINEAAKTILNKKTPLQKYKIIKEATDKMEQLQNYKKAATEAAENIAKTKPKLFTKKVADVKSFISKKQETLGKLASENSVQALRELNALKKFKKTASKGEIKNIEKAISKYENALAPQMEFLDQLRAMLPDGTFNEAFLKDVSKFAAEKIKMPKFKNILPELPAAFSTKLFSTAGLKNLAKLTGKVSLVTPTYQLLQKAGLLNNLNAVRIIAAGQITNLTEQEQEQLAQNLAEIVEASCTASADVNEYYSEFA